jgi:hypothetical protein
MDVSSVSSGLSGEGQSNKRTHSQMDVQVTHASTGDAKRESATAKRQKNKNGKGSGGGKKGGKGKKKGNVATSVAVLAPEQQAALAQGAPEAALVLVLTMQGALSTNDISLVFAKMMGRGFGPVYDGLKPNHVLNAHKGLFAKQDDKTWRLLVEGDDAGDRDEDNDGDGMVSGVSSTAMDTDAEDTNSAYDVPTGPPASSSSSSSTTTTTTTTTTSATSVALEASAPGSGYDVPMGPP